MRYGPGWWACLQPETTREDVWTAAFVSESSKQNQLLATRVFQQQLAEPGWPLTSRERNTGQLCVSPSLDPFFFLKKEAKITLFSWDYSDVECCFVSQKIWILSNCQWCGLRPDMSASIWEKWSKSQNMFFSPWTLNQLNEKLRYEWVDLVARRLWPAAGSTVVQWYSDICCPNSDTTIWCFSCIFYNLKRWSARF